MHLSPSMTPRLCKVPVGQNASLIVSGFPFPTNSCPETAAKKRGATIAPCSHCTPDSPTEADSEAATDLADPAAHPGQDQSSAPLAADISAADVNKGPRGNRLHSFKPKVQQNCTSQYPVPCSSKSQNFHHPQSAITHNSKSQSQILHQSQ